MLVVSFWGKYLHIHHLELIVIIYLSFHMSILKTNGRLSSFYHTYIISSPNIHKCDSRNTSATIMLHFTLQWINMCQKHCTCRIKNFLRNNSTTSRAINNTMPFAIIVRTFCVRNNSFGQYKPTHIHYFLRYNFPLFPF